MAEDSNIISIAKIRHTHREKQIHPPRPKGSPEEEQMREARRRGIRIGDWVARSLIEAAARPALPYYGPPPTPCTDPTILARFDEIIEASRDVVKDIADQNRQFDREITLIRRGKLPTPSEDS
jgi:hypothetical protein